jgi:hypothetical protein
MELVKPQARCLWCRKDDDTDEYDGQMLLTCDGCLARQIHVACDAVRRGAPPLSKEHVMSDQPWFCSTDCQQVGTSGLKHRPELPQAGHTPRSSCAALPLCVLASPPQRRLRESHTP